MVVLNSSSISFGRSLVLCTWPWDSYIGTSEALYWDSKIKEDTLYVDGLIHVVEQWKSDLGMDKLKILRESELFRSLNEHQLKAVSEMCVEKDFEAGAVICKQGCREEKLHVIANGVVGSWGPG